MRDYSRFIPGEEIQQAEPWAFTAIDTAAQRRAAAQRAQQEASAAEQLDQAHQQGYDAGFAAGIQEGQRRAQAQVQAQMQAFLAQEGQAAAQQLQALLAAAQQQLSAAQQSMAQGTLELACELARQVLRRELTVDAQALMPVLREALEVLGADHKAAVLRLNPQDLEALGPLLQDAAPGLALTVRADPNVEAGGCLVESAGTVVDATLPKRWLRVVSTLGQSTAWEPGVPAALTQVPADPAPDAQPSTQPTPGAGHELG